MRLRHAFEDVVEFAALLRQVGLRNAVQALVVGLDHPAQRAEGAYRFALAASNVAITRLPPFGRLLPRRLAPPARHEPPERTRIKNRQQHQFRAEPQQQRQRD